jgi:glucokinase
MKGATRDSDGVVRSLRRFATPRELGPDAVVLAVQDAVAALVAEAPESEAIGLVVPGTVDESAGVALYSENIGWRDIPFRALVAESSGLPVGFGHDVRAGGLAERTLGAARGSRDFLFMPIGTGISGAMVVEGRSIDRMLGGEIGHLDVGSNRRCVCGLTGCLETVATGPSIASIYAERSGNVVVGAKPVVTRMQAGDTIAAGVWNDAVTGIAQALVTYVTLLSPDLIVIGGGLSSAGDLLVEPLRLTLRSRLAWQDEPRIVLAELGELSGNVGAHLLAQRAFASINPDRASKGSPS